MISPSQLGAGYALVPVPPPPDWSAGPGTGIYYRGTSNTTRAHAGNTVYRTPHTLVREAEPGARWPGDLSKMMFLPDGRLVPATPAAFDMMRGAGELVAFAPKASSGVIRTLVPAAAMFTGAAIGFKTTSKHQAWGTIGGAIVGGILGLIFR